MTPPNEQRDWYFRIDSANRQAGSSMSLAHGNVRNLTVVADLVRSHVTNLAPSLIPNGDDELIITIQPKRFIPDE